MSSGPERSSTRWISLLVVSTRWQRFGADFTNRSSAVVSSRCMRPQCSLCNLRHENLLDAAHIKEDSEGGRPIVPNGVAMCESTIGLRRERDRHSAGFRDRGPARRAQRSTDRRYDSHSRECIGILWAFRGGRRHGPTSDYSKNATSASGRRVMSDGSHVRRLNHTGVTPPPDPIGRIHARGPDVPRRA